MKLSPFAWLVSSLLFFAWLNSLFSTFYFLQNFEPYKAAASALIAVTCQIGFFAWLIIFGKRGDK
jgi:hypothetical protein